MRPPRSLRGRITLAALAALALSGIVAGAVLVASIERDGRSAVDAALRNRVERILPQDRDFDGRRGPGGGEPLLAGAGTFVQVAFGDRLLERRGDVPEGAPAVPARLGFATVSIRGDDWRSLTVPVQIAGPGGAFAGDGRLQVLSTLAPVRARVAAVRRIVILVELAALALTGLAAWLFTSLAVRPLARLRAGASRVSGAADLATALPEEDGPEEVRSLAQDLNAMLARLRASTAATERALEATRRFAADAGHELRTPLTGLRANLDVLARNPDLPPEQRVALVGEMAAEQERMVHLLEGLQALARGEAAERLPREDVELSDLVDEAVHTARRRHPEVAYELGEEVPGATVHGWAGGLRLAVENLLDNAALHGRPQGRVRVAIGARDGREVAVRVEDDGPGIPEPDRARVLEPFARGEGTTAPGSGLGLAIVAQQAALHGGALELERSRLGGLAAVLRLPTKVDGTWPRTASS